MHIDITDFVNAACPQDYSASRLDFGQYAGWITWNHAIEDSPDYFMLDDDDKREAFRDFVRSAGAWSDEEIRTWSDIELNALLIQWVSGDLREIDYSGDWTDDDWRDYESDDSICHRIWRGDDGRIYFYIGD